MTSFCARAQTGSRCYLLCIVPSSIRSQWPRMAQESCEYVLVLPIAPYTGGIVLMLPACKAAVANTYGYVSVIRRQPVWPSVCISTPELLIMCSDQDHTELMVLVPSHSLIASSYLNRGCLSCTYLLGIESGNESNNSLTRLQNADAICVYFFCLCSIADSRKDRYVAWSRIVDTSKKYLYRHKVTYACLFVLRNFNATIRSLLSIWYVWHQRMLNPYSVQIIQWIHPVDRNW